MPSSSTAAPLTARDFYSALTIVWLFLLLVALEARSMNDGWRSLVLPIGALLMLLLHARAWRQSMRPAD